MPPRRPQVPQQKNIEKWGVETSRRNQWIEQGLDRIWGTRIQTTTRSVLRGQRRPGEWINSDSPCTFVSSGERQLKRNQTQQVDGVETWAKEYMRLVLRDRGADHWWITSTSSSSSPLAAAGATFSDSITAGGAAPLRRVSTTLEITNAPTSVQEANPTFDFVRSEIS